MVGCKIQKKSKRAWRHLGAATSEFLVAVPVLLLLGLGGLQAGLAYNAKTIVNYATFEAARKGAVNHASASAIQEELGLRIAPLFGGDGSAQKAVAAITRGVLEAKDPRYTKIEILNPTQEAFDDYGVENADGVLEIPNTYLHARDRSVNSNSGVNIQDANILKIRTTYAYKLTIPLISDTVLAVMRRADPKNLQYYLLGRIPITSVATVRMQTPPRFNEKVVSTSGGGALPTDEQDQENDPQEQSQDEQDQGDDDPVEEVVDVDEEDSSDCDDAVSACFPDDTGEGDYGACALEDGSDTGSPFDGSPSSPLFTSTTGSPNQTVSLPSQTIGNPIHLVTGNKYQREVDIAPLPGELALRFERHYNSGASDKDVGLGHGWRHSYQVTLQQQGGRVTIKQGDGRRMVFNATEDKQVYRAHLATDGILRVYEDQASAAIWTRRDGMQLHFDQDGQLRRMISASGQSLSLTYDQSGRLIQVSDPQSRTLALEYYPNHRLKQVYDPAGRSVHYRYDEQGNLLSATPEDRAARQYHYDDTSFPHHLTGITDERHVRFASWAYDDQGRATLSEHAGGVDRVRLAFFDGRTEVTDAQGAVSTYITEQREGIPLITEIKGPGCDTCGRGDVQYRYNAHYQLVEARYKDGRITTYDYDESGRLLALTHTTEIDDQAHQQTRFRYGTSDHPALAHAPASIERQSIHPQSEHRVSLQYNRHGQPTTITEHGWQARPEGYESIERRTVLGYDEQARLSHIDGPRTDVEDITRLSYDAHGRLQALTDPVGLVTEVIAYDAYGRPLKVKHHGILTTVAYNSRGQVTELTRGKRTARYHYNAAGQLIKAEDAIGQYRRYEYDDAGRRIAEIDHQGNRLAVDYDDQSRILARRFARADGTVLRTVAMLYDIEGRLSQFNDNGRTLDLAYHDQGQRVDFMHAHGAAVTARYSAFGQLLAVQRRPTDTVSYAYDAKQHLASITDGTGQQTAYYVNDFGQLSAVISPDSGEQYYRRDAAGNVIEERHADGSVSTYRYDAANRLIHIGKDSGAYTLSYSAQGQLASLQGPTQSTHYTYTPEGDVASHRREIDGHVFTTRYRYNERGQVERKWLANGEVLVYHYYEDGPRIGEVKAIVEDDLIWDDVLVGNLERDNVDALSHNLIWESGLERIARLDTQGRLAEIETEGVLDLRYDYDELGNILGIDGQVNGVEHQEQYRYDSAGRLSQRFGGAKESAYVGYTYDGAGNRLGATRAEFEEDSSEAIAKRLDETGSTDKPVEMDITLYEYDTGSHRLEGIHHQDTSTRYSYNAQGSPTEIKTARPETDLAYTVYQYNDDQRPIKVYQRGELVAEYAYNSYGERVKKTVHTQAGPRQTYYLYDNQRVVAEVNGQGEVERQYLYLEGHVVGLWQHGEFYAVHTNHLGAPLALTDRKQRVVWTASYDAFGAAKVETDPDQNGKVVTMNLRLPGQIEDEETGTYYNYLRDYHPDTGRYLTSDPSGQAGGLNTYLYANANPLRYTDPLGLAPISVEEVRQLNVTDIRYDSVQLRLDCGGVDQEALDFLSRLQESNSILYNETLQTILDPSDGNLRGPARGTYAYTEVYSLEEGRLSNSSVRFARNEISALAYYVNQLGSSTPDNRLALSITDRQQLSNLGPILQKQFGNLLTTQDIERLKSQLPAEYRTSSDADFVPLMVDLYPLYQEILTRFQVKLHTQDDVVKAETALANAQAELQAFLLENHISCNRRGLKVGSQGCKNAARARKLEQALDDAAKSYQDTFEKAYERLANARYLPLINSFYDEEARREELWQMAGSISVAVVGIFVPLTPEDLAIDAALYVGTAGAGKIAKIATDTGLVVRRLFRIGDELAELKNARISQTTGDAVNRIKLARYSRFADYDNLMASPNILRYLDEADPGAWTDDVLARLNTNLADANYAQAFNVNPALAKTWKLVDDAAARTCSFAGDTLVQTSNGLQPIKALQAHRDFVWAKNEHTGAMGYQAIVAHYSNDYDLTVYLDIKDTETGATQEIVSNTIHPFFVQLPQGVSAPVSSEGHHYSGEIANGAWVDAANLKPGYRLLNDDGTWAEVQHVTIKTKALEAFNLSVANDHTYFVTANKDADPVWVHNQCSLLTQQLNNSLESLKRFDADLTDDVFREAIEADSSLLDAWAKMDDFGADDYLRTNVGALEALKTPKKSRPDPSEYLDDAYIASHLAKFDEGAVRFTSRTSVGKYGTAGNSEAFVFPKSEFDRILSETGGDLRAIEDRLGLDPYYLSDSDTMAVYIKREDMPDLKIPSGREDGANSRWLPGGKTSGGDSEAVVDLSGAPFTEISY